MQENKDKLNNSDKNDLAKSIVNHLKLLPPQQLKEAVVLVSVSNKQSKRAYDPITGSTRMKNKVKEELASKLVHGVRFIDPGEAFLCAQKTCSFVTVHYILRNLERAKFVFVFNDQDFKDMPYENQKKAFNQFTRLFSPHMTAEQWNQIFKASMMVVTNSTEDIETYKVRMGQGKSRFLYKPPNNKPFMDNQRAWELAKSIISNQIYLAGPNNENLSHENFIKSVNNLSYLELQDKLYIQLKSNYQDYVPMRLENEWKAYFKRLLFHLENIIVERYKKGEKSAQKQALLLNQPIEGEKKDSRILNFFNSIKEGMNVVEQSYEGPYSLRLMKVMNTLFETLRQQDHQVILEMLLNALYEAGFLRNPLPRKYLMSYFTIKKTLQYRKDPLSEHLDLKFGLQDHNLMQPVQFGRLLCNKMYFNEIMRALINQLIKQLEKDEQNCKSDYRFPEVLSQITRLLENKEGKHGDKATFMSNRYKSKLIKYRALLAYRWVKAIQVGKHTQNQYLNSWVTFVIHASQSQFLDNALRIEGLLKVADAFKRFDRPQLALRLYQRLPKYEAHTQVMEIYEKEKRLVPKLLRFMTPQQWASIFKEQTLKSYCKFLLELGLRQRVRQLCLECMRLAKDTQERDVCRQILIDAGRDESMRIHQAFLERQIINEVEIVVPTKLLEDVREEALKLQAK